MLCKVKVKKGIVFHILTVLSKVNIQTLVRLLSTSNLTNPNKFLFPALADPKKVSVKNDNTLGSAEEQPKPQGKAVVEPVSVRRNSGNGCFVTITNLSSMGVFCHAPCGDDLFIVQHIVGEKSLYSLACKNCGWEGRKFDSPYSVYLEFLRNGKQVSDSI